MSVNGIGGQNPVENYTAQVENAQKIEQQTPTAETGERVSQEVQQQQQAQDTVEVSPRNEVQEVPQGEENQEEVKAAEVQQQIVSDVQNSPEAAVIAQGTNISAARVANLL